MKIRALEACTSFQTCDVLDMTYFDPLVRRAAAQGINTLTLFVIADSYYSRDQRSKNLGVRSGSRLAERCISTL